MMNRCSPQLSSGCVTRPRVTQNDLRLCDPSTY